MLQQLSRFIDTVKASILFTESIAIVFTGRPAFGLSGRTARDFADSVRNVVDDAPHLTSREKSFCNMLVEFAKIDMPE